MIRKWIIASVIALAAMACLIVAYLAASKERAGEAESEKPVASVSQVTRDAKGEVTIRLEAAAQQRLALKAATLEAIQFRPEIRGYGRVLDPTPLASLVSELEADLAGAEASRQEFERQKTLAAQNNGSARALQEAQAACLQDQTRTGNARQRLLAMYGRAMAERADLADFVQSLALQQSALVRIDLLPGDVLQAPPEGARLYALADENKALPAQYLSVAPTVDALTQGEGLFFVVTPNQSRLAPGAAVAASVPDADKPLRPGVEIPGEAVVRFNGQAWVFLQTGGELFTRREIELEHPTLHGWFVPAGLEPGARVVVRGAQMLLSEEQKSQIQVGD